MSRPSTAKAAPATPAQFSSPSAFLDNFYASLPARWTTSTMNNNNVHPLAQAEPEQPGRAAPAGVLPEREATPLPTRHLLLPRANCVTVRALAPHHQQARLQPVSRPLQPGQPHLQCIDSHYRATAHMKPHEANITNLKKNIDWRC